VTVIVILTVTVTVRVTVTLHCECWRVALKWCGDRVSADTALCDADCSDSSYRQ